MSRKSYLKFIIVNCVLLYLIIEFKFYGCLIRFINPCANLNQNINTKDKMDSANKRRIYGPGEGGTPVQLDTSHLTEEEKEENSKHQFNVVVSDMISVHRTLNPDLIHPKCREITYGDLEPCTVLIAFKDEHWSTLIRTIHSILERTPDELLDEIILIDDGSKRDDLKYKLDVYVSYLPKVRIIRLNPLIGSRTAAVQRGMDEAKSKYVAVFDGHMEVYDGWIEPLLQRVNEMPKMLVTPVVGSIDPETFKYYIYDPDLFLSGVQAMSFDFYLYQQWSKYKPEYIKTLEPTKPIRTAGLQANAFLVNKDFFQQLGGFDTGMKVWGCEMFELMFKYIMCDGDIEVIPCSHVGHLYRKAVVWGKEVDESQVANAYRVAEVWMDEYKHLVFERFGNYTLPMGDVSERKKVRARNNCRSFQYYLDHIREIIDIYVPLNLKASGLLSLSISRGTGCMTSSQTVYMSLCQYKGMHQFWELSSDNEIRSGTTCLIPENKGMEVTTKLCDTDRFYQWIYQEDNTIKSQENGLCLTVDGIVVFMDDCVGSPNQIWTWKRK